MSTERFEYVRDELAKAKALVDETKALIDEYSTPASGMPHTPAQGCTCHPTDESTWTTYGSAVEPGSMWEPDPDCPEHGAHTEILTAQPGAGDAETSGAGSGRGTGGPKAHGSAQAAERIKAYLDACADANSFGRETRWELRAADGRPYDLPRADLEAVINHILDEEAADER